jgi:hypothetical protein
VTRMVRKQVYIEPEQERLLKQRSSELGVTEAELIRRGINSIVAVPRVSLPRDPDAWERELAFINSRIGMVAPQTDRRWKREDLYDRWERHHPDRH